MTPFIVCLPLSWPHHEFHQLFCPVPQKPQNPCFTVCLCINMIFTLRHLSFVERLEVIARVFAHLEKKNCGGSRHWQPPAKQSISRLPTLNLGTKYL